MPAELDFPDGAIPIGMEIAFGADINGDQDSWVWTSVTPDPDSLFMKQTVTTTRGRQDESSDVAPTAADIVLDNPDGDLTPDNPLSQYFPNVDLGAPARWWIQVSSPRLYLRPMLGSKAYVNSVSTLNISTDIDIRIDMHLKTMSPDGTPVAIAGRANGTSLFSWRVLINADRTVTLQWSPTGAAPILSITSATPVVPMSARSTMRVTLDRNNGAGGRTATFYTGPDVTGPFTQVGPDVIQAGTTSINNAAAPLTVGVPPDLAVASASDADVYAFRVRNGIGGPSVAYVLFTDQTPEDTSFVDIAGRTWHVNVPFANVTNRWYRIVGTIDSWAPVWPWGDLSSQIPGGIDEGQARVDLEIAGVLRRLGQGAPILQSPLRRSTSASSTLRASWPMEDEDGSTQIASGLEGGSPMSVAGVIDFASDSDLPGSKPLPEMSGNTSLYGSVVGSFSGHWRVNWYVRIASPTSGQIVFMRVTGTGTVLTWLVSTNAGNVTLTGVDGFGVTVVSATGAGTDFFDRWVNVQLTVEQSGTSVNWSLYWFPVRYPAAGGSSLSGAFSGVGGGVTALASPPDVDADGMATGHWSVFDEGGTPVPTNAAMGWTGDTAAARMVRLCAEEGVSFRIIGNPATTTQVGVQQVATLLELLNDAKNVDGGILYEQPDHVGLIYRTRESMYNQPPNMILDAHQEQLQNPFAPVLDDQRIRNDIIVTRTGGSSVEVVDDASIAKSGTYGEPVTLNLFADSQLQDAAGWLLHQGTVPGMRYPSLVTDLGVATEVIDSWLTTDVGAQVHVINLPPQHPTEIVKVVVEGYGEPISPFTWDPAMNCSPAGVWDVAVLDGDGVDDQYLLRLESDSSKLAVAATDVATTFVVTVVEGPPWTSDNAETPFDIRIEGERVTVTDIAAPAGAAAFTGYGVFSTIPSTLATAPSVTAPAIGDLLICAWCSYSTPGTYTLPAGMTIRARTDQTFSSFEDASKTLVAAGATGPQTAIFSASDVFATLSVVVHAASGSPGVQEFLSTSSPGSDVTLTTVTSAVVGDWLLVLQAWDWDPGNNLDAPSGGGWTPVADSVKAASSISRVRAWAKRVVAPGVQSVTFFAAGGVNDNHARLYLLTGVVGVTQDFTVVRSVNQVVRAHAAGTPFELWFQPVLAR